MRYRAATQIVFLAATLLWLAAARAELHELPQR
jgi:hypothetical protein